jgi:hypothetical protein
VWPGSELPATAVAVQRMVAHIVTSSEEGGGGSAGAYQFPPPARAAAAEALLKMFGGRDGEGGAAEFADAIAVAQVITRQAAR